MTRYVALFCGINVGRSKRSTMANAAWGEELVHVGKNAAYVWCANGILDIKIAVAVLQNLAQSGTARNGSTVEKVYALMQKTT